MTDRLRTLQLTTCLTVAAAACGETPTPPPEPTFHEVEKVALMEAHYTSAITAHDKLIRNDLDGFRSAMVELAAQVVPAHAPKPWVAPNAALREAAGQATGVTTMAEAAEVMGRVVLHCGACHVGGPGGPQYGTPKPPVGATPLETKMLEHQWATERLWEGVTGPLDESWTRGAEAIASTDVLPADASPELKTKQDALRSLGEQAKAAADATARSAAYGSLLAGCADCHEAAQVTFGE